MEIKVVEYRPEMAAAVAAMWNKSSDGWGGRTAVMTAEQVEARENTSGNLNVFLALDGSEVIGYCSLAEYREDQGALYIPLLNVRGDYQGKKIGKRLLLKAIERTVELGWPRLDLYTWPGNTKAVPLYKKCGFFWENRDGTTHLMNFIPSVLQTEAVAPFFEQTDWTEALVKEIVVQPDGQKVEGFELYEYVWQAQDRTLRLEFERSGRGLRLIETDDYRVELRAEKHDCLSGKTYQAFFTVRNKSGQPLDIRIEGTDNDVVRFPFRHEQQIEEELTLQAPFTVGRLAEEQSPWRTHPVLGANVWINGRRAELKTGLHVRLPVKLRLHSPKYHTVSHDTGLAFLDVENHAEREATVHFTLPQTDWITFKEMEQEILLQGKEKRSIPLAYDLKAPGFYQQEIAVTSVGSGEEALQFTYPMAAAFQGPQSFLYGETETEWVIMCDDVQVKLEKFNNMVEAKRCGGSVFYARWAAPQVGKPYLNELTKKKPDDVRFEQEEQAIVMKAFYSSSFADGLKLVRVLKLYRNQLLEQYYELQNESTQEIEDLWLNEPLWYSLRSAVLPYGDNILTLDRFDGDDLNDWVAERISENWIFSTERGKEQGISWTSAHRLSFQGYQMALECEIGVLAAQAQCHTPSTFHALGTFNTWQQLRRFTNIRERRQQEQDSFRFSTAHKSFELLLNEGNPVLTQDCDVRFQLNHQQYLNGDVKLMTGQKTLIEARVEQTDECRSKQFLLSPNDVESVSVVEGVAQTSTREYRQQALLLRPVSRPIELYEEEHEGRRVLHVSNGKLSIKAAEDFFPTLYSMQYNGQELLDHAFPKAVPKSWWNPWGGGMCGSPDGVSNFSLSRNGYKLSEAELHDQFGNSWKGIKIGVQLTQHDKLEGLRWNHYYVTLPDIPLLAHTVELIQTTGKYWDEESWVNDTYLPLRDQLKVGMIENGKEQFAFLGKGQLEILSPSSFCFYHLLEEHVLQLFAAEDEELELYCNQEVALIGYLKKLSLAHGERQFLPATFYLLTENRVEEEALQTLKQIRFTKRDL